MKRKRSRPGIFAKSPFYLLNNAILAHTLSDDGYRNLVAQFLVSEDDNIFFERLDKLLESRRFSQLITANARTVEQFGKTAFHASGMSVQRVWQLFQHILIKNSGHLTDFVKFRDGVEKLIVTGHFAEALEYLNECVAQCGESLWYIRCKMLILAAQGKNSQFDQFSELIKRRAGASFAQHLFHCCQTITAASDPLLSLKALVFSSVTEYVQAKHADVAALLQLLFVPTPLQGKFDAMDCLQSLQGFPVIDQYNGVLAILRLLVAEGRLNESSPYGLMKTLVDLQRSVPDPILCRLLEVSQAGSSAPHSKADSSLIGAYDSGEYEAAVEIFERKKTTIKNPLAYCNLIAKSLAHRRIQTTEISSKNLLDSTVGHLTAIYRLDPLWIQSEKAILSNAIKYHFLLISPHIQLTLFKALPYRYADRLTQFAAKLAVATDVEITPMTVAMSNNESCIVSSLCDELADKTPVYRQLKKTIISAINEGASNEVMSGLLSSYQNAVVLTKDFIELASHYYLRVNDEISLVEFSAAVLIDEPDRYIYLPMGTLIKIIEDRQLADLAAVVVAFYYNKYVSQSKDFVLNEAFEQFVEINDAEVPSQILNKKTALTEMEKIFFRDVCAPEVMDFLSCFNNTTELRAERLNILDMLLEREVVSSKERILEVEEIVGRVIVDAGASDFNGSKIFVDDTAIRKKHLAEIASLVAYYQQAEDQNDEGFKVLGEGGSPRGLVHLSGKKNNAVLSMCRVLADAFQHDEKYGLDKNLSAEIRHGFFSNLMKARLEEHKLITETDDAGQYRPNVYWREQTSVISEDAWKRIETDLRRFATDFNNLIAEAEEWMKISNASDASTRVFFYGLGKSEFDEIRAIVSSGADADAVSSAVLRLMWDKTEVALDKIRSKIDGVFRDRVDSLFEKLEFDISTSKRGMVLPDLMSAISRARNEIKEDITTASNWFNRTENSEVKSRTLGHVMEIAISSFEQVKGGAFAIKKGNSSNLSQLEIPGPAIKQFIIAIINLLDNCYRHSGLGRETRVEILGKATATGGSILITNNLAAEKQVLLTPEIISAIHEKILNADAGNLIRSEGGSGLVKAHNAIAPYGKRCTVSVTRTESHFSAEIIYEP